MDISWLGHSCFRIKGSKATLITDPYPPELGYALGKPSADIVTVSHQHPAHSYVQGIDGKPRPITGPGEYEINDVLIIGLTTFHDGERGKKRGKNTIYLIEMDDVTICHLGDLGHQLSDKQAADLGKIDILFIPVGGHYTIDAAGATSVCDQLKPRVIIPMHYKTNKCTYPIADVDDFLKGKKNVKKLDATEVEFKAAELPSESQILGLKPAL